MLTARLDDTIKVSELFGPTLQGEGPTQGRPAGFIRLALCNLDCRWCDTPYTWDWTGKNGVAYDRSEQIHSIPIRDLLLWAEPFPRVVITGGEPLAQRRKTMTLANHLVEDRIVEVETNGTISADGYSDDINFTVSPKIGNSGVSWNKAINRDVLVEYVNRLATFKFVISTADDVLEVQQLAQDIQLPRYQTWLMPEGRTRVEILDRLPWLFDVCAEFGYSLATRLHVLAHDDRRGV